MHTFIVANELFLNACLATVMPFFVSLFFQTASIALWQRFFHCFRRNRKDNAAFSNRAKIFSSQTQHFFSYDLCMAQLINEFQGFFSFPPI